MNRSHKFQNHFEKVQLLFLEMVFKVITYSIDIETQNHYRLILYIDKLDLLQGNRKGPLWLW